MPLVVLEGPEGSGKTTQIRLLGDWLASERRPALMMREPGGTKLGDEVRRLLLHGTEITPRAESLLFMASRAELVEREIQPALTSGSVVLLDRFFLSTYAYQVAGRGLPHDQVGAANALATSGLRPDLTILLSLPVEEGLARAAKRGAKDRMEQANLDFHKRVAAAFAEFATADWQRSHPEAGPVVTIDATGSEQEVHQRIVAALGKFKSGLV
jgi:dTMP kinase